MNESAGIDGLIAVMLEFERCGDKESVADVRSMILEKVSDMETRLYVAESLNDTYRLLDEDEWETKENIDTLNRIFDECTGFVVDAVQHSNDTTHTNDRRK